MYPTRQSWLFRKDDRALFGATDARACPTPTIAPRRYYLLTQAILRMPEPDLAAALQPRTVAPEWPWTIKISFRSSAARRRTVFETATDRRGSHVLGRINPPASPALVFKARVLRARSFQQDNHLPEAAREWQSVVSDKPEFAGQQASILYNLDSVINVWTNRRGGKILGKCLAKNSAGDENSACALSLPNCRSKRAISTRRLACSRGPWKNTSAIVLE